MIAPDITSCRATIAAAFPDLADDRLTVLDAGWDSIAIEAGGLIFKFPRHEAAAGRLRREARVLAALGPAVTMALPDMTLHPGPPEFSRHAMLPGSHLLAADYERLGEGARQALAERLARLYAELHAVDGDAMRAAGAEPVHQWIEPEQILDRLGGRLAPDLDRFMRETVAAWRALPPDPHGDTFGWFDGHGWNMAFDRAAGRLAGVYDFGDSGFGPLHREFVYPNWISRDLTARIVARYEALTGRAIDRGRVELLSGVLRLSEAAEYCDDPEHAPAMLGHVAAWAAG